MPLILLPGLAANASMWASQLTALSGLDGQGPVRWPVHVTDVHMRHGSIEAMASALLEDHPSGDLVLCGASMGGIVAMEVARQAPERLRGLALLGTNARPETPEVRALREAAMQLFRDGRVLDVLQANLPLAFHADALGDAALTSEYLRFVMAAGVDQLLRQNQAIIGRPDARTHLPGLRCPTLVMCGESDLLTPPECAHEIASLIPGAKLVMLPRCGHMLTMEQPQAVNTQLLDWLGRLSG